MSAKSDAVVHLIPLTSPLHVSQAGYNQHKLLSPHMTAGSQQNPHRTSSVFGNVSRSEHLQKNDVIPGTLNIHDD